MAPTPALPPPDDDVISIAASSDDKDTAKEADTDDSGSPRKNKGKAKEVDREADTAKDIPQASPAPAPSPFPPNCPLVPPASKESLVSATRRLDNNALSIYNRSVHLERDLQDLRIPSSECARSLSSIASSLQNLTEAIIPHLPHIISLMEQLVQTTTSLDGPSTLSDEYEGAHDSRSRSPSRREGVQARSTNAHPSDGHRGRKHSHSPRRREGERTRSSSPSRPRDHKDTHTQPLSAPRHPSPASGTRHSVDEQRKQGKRRQAPAAVPPPPAKKPRRNSSRSRMAPPVASSSTLSLPPPDRGNQNQPHIEYGSFYAFVGPANWSRNGDESRNQLLAILSYLDSSAGQPALPDVMEYIDPNHRLLRLTFSTRNDADRLVTYINTASRVRLPSGYEQFRARRTA
ncbi:hypothetical protein D9758_011468 [Tetrapyrgos nigripes]|uniref:Uncharacterized protein n=1 Tax=Tetrapyrgos nigripes TaxID=182062 RepID=A0A8H5FQW9_9AGAR|nr:hypothetical protein D9758_011468 [Tetrapyrgos nigripes]